MFSVQIQTLSLALESLFRTFLWGTFVTVRWPSDVKRCAFFSGNF